MVEQHHNIPGDQENSSSDGVTRGVVGDSGNAALPVSTDLDLSEQLTKQLLDTLPSASPTAEVDNFILQIAADAVESPGEHAPTGSGDQATNVIPLYRHENEISFRQVFPKVFVAAAVVVLAVVVVPLVDRMGFTGFSNSPSMQTASSDSEDLSTEQVAASEMLSSNDTDALVESVIEEDASDELSSVQVESKVPEGEGVKAEAIAADTPARESIENPFLKELAVAAESDAADPQSDDEPDESGVAGVTRTTTISTEATAVPSVVQNINITSAARVQRSVDTGDAAATGDAALNQSVTQKSSANFAEFLATNSDESSSPGRQSALSAQVAEPVESGEVAPAFRRSSYRWKAEILKLSRLGKQQRAEDEYELYIQEYPLRAFVFNQADAEPQATDIFAPVTPVATPSEIGTSPEK